MFFPKNMVLIDDIFIKTQVETIKYMHVFLYGILNISVIRLKNQLNRLFNNLNEL